LDTSTPEAEKRKTYKENMFVLRGIKLLKTELDTKFKK
jgi:hypothetical protein